MSGQLRRAPLILWVAGAIVLSTDPLSAVEDTASETAPNTATSEAAEPAPDAVDPAPAAQDSNEASSAVVLIEGLNASLLDVLKQSNELGYQQRYDLLAPALQETFDLEYMARQSVGRAFLDLADADRQTWYALFANYMTANYASRFDHYSGQTFEIVGEEPGAKDTVLIRTKVIDPGQEDVPLGYRVRETPDGCKVVDVYLKGTISELALRRSEYAAVLKREGFDPLVASVKARIASLESGKGE